MNLINLFKTATFRQSVITTASITFNGVLATVFYLLVAKALGVGEYGLFSLSAATVAIMSVVFDFGNDRGMVKFISKYGSESPASQKILKAVFLTKISTCIFFLVLFTIFAEPISVLLFNQPGMAKLLPLTALAFSTQILLFFVTYYFQAAEKFVTWGMLFITANFIRLILLFVLSSQKMLIAQSALFLFALTPFLSFLVGFWLMGWKFLKARIDKTVFSEIFSFNKWVIGFSSVSTVSSRLDTFLTSYLLPISSVGIYGLATQATLIMPNLVSALGAVTSPKFSRFNQASDNRKYLFKSTIFFLIIAVTAGLILVPLGYIFMSFSGPEYLQGFYPFLILVLSQVIFLATSPLRDSILYYHSRPDFFFWVSLAHGLITLVSGLILLPRLGLMGASLSNLAGQVLLNVASLSLYLRLSRQK